MPDDLISKKPLAARAQFITQSGTLLFNVAIIFFILVLAAWGGLYFFRRSLDTNAANWREQIITVEKELRPDFLNQLVALSDRLTAVREIISGHKFSSNTLLLLERDTHPQVAFSSFQYSADGRKIDLAAKAASYGIVADQVTLLEADSQVESVGFGGLQLDETGRVNFKLSIIFKASLLQLRSK